MTPAPATCTCGAAIAGLLSFTDTPYYACGTIAWQRCLATPAPEVANVRTPTDAELAEYAGLIELASIAWVRDPRIGICSIHGCDRVAIDGLCLTHA